MDTSIFADLTKTGPGIWFSLHTEAIKSTTDETKRSFITFVNYICDSLKCQKCQTHFRKFINTHNFIHYWNIKDNMGRDIGFYKWTWEAHNLVNKFLGKPLPTLTDSYNFYANYAVGVCINCTNSPPLPPSSPDPIGDILTPYIDDKNITKKTPSAPIPHPTTTTTTTTTHVPKFRLLPRPF